MDGPAIAIVRSPRPWARALHRYVADYGGAVVRARPLEERQALEEDYEVLLVDDVSSFLTHRLVQELHRRGRRILGVFDPEEHVAGAQESAGKERLRALGVDDVIDANAAPEEFLQLVHGLAPSWDPEGELAKLVSGEELDSHERLIPEPGGQPRPAGLVVAVAGTAGGSGATEIAIELGRIVRRRGEVSVVVDADELAPSIAQRLGMPLHPNLRAAVDALEHGTGMIADCLVGAPGGQATVLCGLPHAKDWSSLRPDEVIAVIDELARVCHFVVVNVAHYVEDLSGISGMDRFGVSRAVLERADTVVLVGTPSPVGISRLLDRAADMASLAPMTPVHMAVNRAPASAFVRGEVIDEIQRTYIPASLHFIPPDRKVEEAAWRGTLVEPGPFAAALAEIALDVAPSDAEDPALKKSRMPALRVGRGR